MFKKMFKNTLQFLSIIVLSFVLFSGHSFAQNCQLDNEHLQAMPESTLGITNSKGETVQFDVKTASNNRTRSAGFQRVCESTIASKPILFVFDTAGIPSFHMRNVVAPIDIAFIDPQGQIESIQSMFPYVLGSKSRPLYSPQRKVIAALEVHPGFYVKHNIEVGAMVTWALVDINVADELINER